MRQLEETLLLLAGQDPAIDSEELIDRIELHLSEENVPVVAGDRSSIMQTGVRRPQTAPPRRLKKASLLAAAVLAVVAAIGTPLWLLGGDGPEDAVSEPEGVFSWGEGRLDWEDILDWVTAEEMKATFESSTMHWEGGALSGGEVVFERFDDEGHWIYEWGYEPTSPELRSWRVSVHRWDWEAYPFPDATQTDRRLPDGVVFWTGWGEDCRAWPSQGGRCPVIEGLRGPNSSEAITINLSNPYYLYSPPDTDLTSDDKDDTYFQIASMMLRELGWAD